MAFPPRFLDEIRSRVSLADLVGRRVKLVRRGREFAGLCPFHNERTPSFTVVEDKGFYHCFGCGAHGDAIGFTMKTENLPFPEAVEKLAGEAGLTLPERDARAEAEAHQTKSLHEANEAAAEWFTAQLAAPHGRTGLDYLRRRGLSGESIARFRLGYAPDTRDALKRALMAKGIAEGLLLEAGLVAKPDDERATYDRFRGRVMYPITDRRGRVIAFGGRVIGDGQPKYLNSPETPIFQKGRVLYALREARAAMEGGAELIVVEGYMDVIALHQAGFDGAVAPLGTALTETHIEELWRLKPEPLLCFDGDEAGRRAAVRAAERVLPLLRPGHSLRFAFLPEGEDPDSLIREAGAAALSATLTQALPLVEWLWQIETGGRKLDTPERRAGLRKSLRDRAAVIAERSVQSLYLAEFESRVRRLFRPERETGFRNANERRYRRPQRSGLGGLAGGVNLKSDGNTRRVALRAQQALLGALINHPQLIDEAAENLAYIALGTGSELDRLRAALLNGGVGILDTTVLRNQLTELGFSAILGRILTADLYAQYPWTHPKAKPDQVLEGWRHVYAHVVEKPRVEREFEAAEKLLAEEPNPRNLGRFNSVKHQTAAARGSDEELASADVLTGRYDQES